MNIIVLLNSLIYAVLGIVIFCVGFIVIDKITPYDLWKEIVEKRNTALALLLGLGALGVCLIIAAAIH